MYTFVKTYDNRIKKELWFCRLDKNTSFDNICKSVRSSLYQTFDQDPHEIEYRKEAIKNAKNAEDIILWTLYSADYLAPKWLETAKFLVKNHKYAYVNKVGGMRHGKGLKILEKVSRKIFRFPSDLKSEEKEKLERITIKRWSNAKHWYLCSNKDRLFSREKYVDVNDAIKEAKRYVPMKRIEVKEN